MEPMCLCIVFCHTTNSRPELIGRQVSLIMAGNMETSNSPQNAYLNCHQDAITYVKKLSYSLGLHLSLGKTEFASHCISLNLDDTSLNRVRNNLFFAAQVSGLADERALPVSRKGTSLHPLSEKLIEDIWYLADCISSGRNVKRVMYKSGKRNTQYLENRLSSCNAPSSVSSLNPSLFTSEEIVVHESGTEQKCVEENGEEAGVRMGADGEYVLGGN